MSIENVSILFTDVVGSTELSQRLSPEAADAVRREHFSILRQALAEAGGREVKNLGDGLMAVFVSASAALACAVSMQQSVERNNRRRDHSVGLRVGLSGGEVTKEEDDYFGDPVVEAARLCATCESGQVLATDVVRAMAGRRNRHECRALGERLLKGLPDPVETVEVVWELLAEVGTNPVPLPPRLGRRPWAGVVGRDVEIATIMDALKRVAGGEGREVLLVSGEPGVGKTTLVAEAARNAFDAGSCVLFGHCEEDLATPYQLFAEALGHLVAHASDDQLLAHIEEYGSELARLVPALASRIPDLPPTIATDADTERFLFFAAVVGLLGMVSAHQPVVLVLDDLHWADKGSLLLLRHLSATEQSIRVLVLGAYRDNELSHRHPLLDTLAALRRQSGVSRIEVDGLDDNGVVAFLEAAAGQTLDDDGVGLAHAVYRETDGNPFFVSEVLRHLVETRVIYQDAAGRWVAEGSLDQMTLPASIREVIGARVGRLGPEAEHVLSLAAVVGRDFDLDLLARAARTTEDEVLDVLDAATAASLIRELPDNPGHYNFAHALIQHTLYEDITPTRRARAHRQVAEALEDLCRDSSSARLSELSRHWIAAMQPVDLDKAIDYTRRAADAALSALAPADALRYYVQALELYRQTIRPDKLLGVDLTIGLGVAQRQTGDPAFRDTLLDAAREAADLGDTERLVVAALANNRGWFSSFGQVDQQRVAVLEAALGAMPVADSPRRALLLATLCSELSYSPSSLQRRLDLAGESMAMAERLNDPVIRLQVVSLCDVAVQIPSLNAKRLEETTEALELAEEVGDPVLLFLVASVADKQAIQAGRFAVAQRCMENMKETSRRLQQPTLMWTAAYREATYAQLVGDPARAEELADIALKLGTESGQPDAFVFYGTQIMGIRRQQGRLGELVPLVQEVVTANPGVPSYEAALALAHLESENEIDAHEMFEAAASRGFSLPQDAAWFGGIMAYASLAINLREREAAGTLFDLLAPHRRELPFDGVIPLEPIAMYLGGLAWVLERDHEAEDLFSEARSLAQVGGMKYAVALTELLWGTMLAAHEESEDRAKAQELLECALSAAVSQGYRKIERRTAALLAGLN